jgi:hypothetical protein
MSRRIGPVQVRLLGRAARTQSGNVMPAGYLERRALRRLERRGIVAPLPSFPDVWTLKEDDHGTPA